MSTTGVHEIKRFGLIQVGCCLRGIPLQIGKADAPGRPVVAPALKVAELLAGGKGIHLAARKGGDVAAHGF
jgi:hypothetical protein